MTPLLFMTLFFGYIYEDTDSLLVDNDTLTICGNHQYAIKVHLKNHGQLFVRAATGALDSTGWLVLDAPLIVIAESSFINGSERGYKGAYLNSHPRGYGPGGGWAGGVSGGGGGAYGGDGRVGGDYYGGAGGTAYGDPSDTLIEMGSGGGGGAGGGRIKILSSSLLDTLGLANSAQGGVPGLGDTTLPASSAGNSGSIYIGALTGFAELSREQVVLPYIVPNPIRTALKIRIDKVPVMAKVYDCAGKVTKEFWLRNTHESVNLSELPQGIYFLEIDNVPLKPNKIVIIE